MYAVLNKTSLRIISLVLLLFAAFVVEGFLITKADSCDIRNPERRTKYLEELGLIIDETTLVESEVAIPKEFGDVYSNYNEIQLRAGFDLKDYKGVTVTKYTYKVLNRGENVCVNLLCYKGKVIGGDISSSSLDGFMVPLSKE